MSRAVGWVSMMGPHMDPPTTLPMRYGLRVIPPGHDDSSSPPCAGCSYVYMPVAILVKGILHPAFSFEPISLPPLLKRSRGMYGFHMAR